MVTIELKRWASMDIRAPVAILSFDMLKRLITLLALLTGLAAVGVPVQARAGDIPAGVSSAYDASSKCELERRQADAQRKRPTAQRKAERCPCPKPTPLVVFPPLMFGADLALE